MKLSPELRTLHISPDDYPNISLENVKMQIWFDLYKIFKLINVWAVVKIFNHSSFK